MPSINDTFDHYITMMIGMVAVFQMPNKFFEQNGKIVGMLGQDWDLAWKRSGAILQTA